MFELDPQAVREAEDNLYQILQPQVAEVINMIKSGSLDYEVKMPESFDVDVPLEVLAAKVARSSNVYWRMARFAGITKADFKLAKGRYDRKYKQNRIGKNTDEREENAMKASQVEHSAMVVAEAVSDLADSLERAARVASETSRKLLDKAQAMQIATKREGHGIYPDSDFSPY